MSIHDRWTWDCPHGPTCHYFLAPDVCGPSKCHRDRIKWDYHWRLKAIMAMPMKKPDKDKLGQNEAVPWKDAEFEKQWPYLAQFLQATRWDDGSLRETGTLLFFVQEGFLKCCVNDRANERSAFCTGATVECLFDLVEAGLETDKLDWRQRRKA